jgi:putative redox protein
VATPSAPAVFLHPAIEVEWVGGTLFDAHRHEEPSIRIDADAKTAPSPVDALLAALATCSATDVVSILHKQRTPVRRLSVRVEAQRVHRTPRRLAAAVLHFQIAAPGSTTAKATRAVELAVSKYCSVRSSLDPEIPVTWTVDLRT